MISHQELRKKAVELKVGVDTVEKDYVLGWMLYGIANSSISNKLVFKGGTALSKIYFPNQWRLSEDLDFTPIGNTAWEKFVKPIEKEIPNIVMQKNQIALKLEGSPYTNPGYFQSRFKYTGPISTARLKIEISREEEIGKIVAMPVPQYYDYPKFSVSVYSLETILAEKLRAILQRRKIRDYYDVWRLLKENKIWNGVGDLFLKKCETKNVKFTGIGQFFPEDIEEVLKEHLRSLTRLINESINIPKMLSEIREEIPNVIE